MADAMEFTSCSAPWELPRPPQALPNPLAHSLPCSAEEVTKAVQINLKLDTVLGGSIDGMKVPEIFFHSC